MDHTQLKLTAVAVWGFSPKWPSPLCDKIIARTEAAGTPPAAYFRAIATNKKVPGSVLLHENMILSLKWDQFVEDELKLMRSEANVKFDSDVVEFRSAVAICRGDRRAVLEDENFNITRFGRYRISLAYGFQDVADKYESPAFLAELANPFLTELYEKLGR